MAKRLFDVLVSMVAAVLLSPLLVMVSIAIFLSLGRPIFFIQQRPGLKGKPFNLVKFRTMLNSVSDDGFLLPDERRVTRLGAFIRSTSLDELPELFNVLRGDMSLVGPRPLLMEYLPLYSAHQRRRHEVKPGITGWAQVNGRNSVSWSEKFEMDVWYVDHHSLCLDLKILALTVFTVLRRKGVSKEGHATTDYFKGNGE
jgi:sugar transferase EpsL